MKIENGLSSHRRTQFLTVSQLGHLQIETGGMVFWKESKDQSSLQDVVSFTCRVNVSLKSWWCQDVSHYRIYFRWSSFHPSSHCCHDESIKYLIYPQAFKGLPQDIVSETLNPPKALSLFSHFKQQKQTQNPLLPNKSCSQVAEWFPTTTWSWQLKSQLEEEQQDISHYTIHEALSLTCIKKLIYCIQN